MMNKKDLNELQKLLDEMHINLADLIDAIKSALHKPVGFYEQCPKEYQAKIDEIVEYTKSLTDDLAIFNNKTTYGVKLNTDHYCIWWVAKNNDKYLIKLRAEHKNNTDKIKELDLDANVFNEIKKTINAFLDMEPIEDSESFDESELEDLEEPKETFYYSASFGEKILLDEFYKLIMSLPQDWDVIDKPHMYLFIIPTNKDKDANVIWIEKDCVTKKLELHFIKDGEERSPILLTDRDVIDHARSVLRIAFDDPYYKARNKVYRCLNNSDDAEEFSEEEFLDMADWDYVPEDITIQGYLQLEDGYRIPYSSSEEKAIIRYLKDNKCYKRLRAQSFSIEYTTPNASSYKTYYPDLIMLTHDNRIAIIEVKQLANFSNYINLSKYEALKEYCEENGYMYCMIDKNFTSLTDIIQRKVKADVEKEFLRRIKSQDSFTMTDIYEMKNAFRAKEYEIIADVQSLIINNNLVNNDKYDTEIDCRHLRKMKFDLI